MSHYLDYQAVGLRVGLEVHQQLFTERKMFCHCPAGRYTETHDGEVLRHMRPTLSELGVYDGTALMELKTRKNIIYLLHKDNVCTYEMDDTPPFLINQQALDVAVEQCLMLGCDIVDEVHIARKQYLDGSIPTGFQRTAIVGVNGRLPFRGRELSVIQVSVEEDSCREVRDRGHLVVWRTDRLGMPLIETVTGPDLRTPEEVEAAILLVGRVCRSTGHVRVGAGASRQDINVSVRGGERVEIKGIPSARWAPALVHGEAVRQVNLLRLRDELARLGFSRAEDIQLEHRDVTYLFASSGLPFLRQEGWDQLVAAEQRRPSFELGAGRFCVRAIRLPGLVSTLNWPTQPDHTFAHELSGRVRVVACLDQQPILLHSEKWPDYAEGLRDVRKLKKRLRCRPEDGVVVVWGPEQDVMTAIEEIRLRYVAALEGVPLETRQGFIDGSTDFERILPGPDRMYPDTDSPPVKMTRERVRGIQAGLPPLPWVREARYAAAGLRPSTVHYLIRRGFAGHVEAVVERAGADLARAGRFFGETLRGALRRDPRLAALELDHWLVLFRAASDKPVLFEAWRRLALELVRVPHRPLVEIVRELGLDQAPGNVRARVELEAQNLRVDHPHRDPAFVREQRLRLLMGVLMPKLQGRVPGAEVAAIARMVLIQREPAPQGLVPGASHV